MTPITSKGQAMTNTPAQDARALLTEAQIVKCLVHANCLDTVTMSYESGPYNITRPTYTTTELVRAIESEVRAALAQPATPATSEPDWKGLAESLLNAQAMFEKALGFTDEESAAGLCPTEIVARIEELKAAATPAEPVARASAPEAPAAAVTPVLPDEPLWDHQGNVRHAAVDRLRERQKAAAAQAEPTTGDSHE